MNDPRLSVPSDPRRSARFITHSPPSPGISGDRIRVYHLMRALKARDWKVRLWSLFAPDEPTANDDAVRAITDEVVLVPRDVSAQVRRSRLVRDIASRGAFQAHWFWSRASAQAAAEWLSDAGDEVLFVEQLYMYPFVPDHLRPRVVLDTQNHEAARMRAMAVGGGSVARRVVARLQVGPVTAFERAAVASVGSVLAVSAVEAAAFESMAPGRVRLVPNGVDTAGIVPLSGPPASRVLLFVGSLSYGANVDAVRHFSSDIAPHLVGSDATLTVVGSSPTRAVYEAAASAPLPVRVMGYAPDLYPHYTSSRAMIVPLRHGGGTRLKILEALAWGLPVVTTSVGAEGLGLEDGRHVLIADDPLAFAAAVERLLRDDSLWRALSTAGRAYVEQRYDWQQIATTFDAAMTEVADGATASLPSPESARVDVTAGRVT